jgi:photosystem II stability/assembly factor-like uncharacterized protein
MCCAALVLLSTLALAAAESPWSPSPWVPEGLAGGGSMFCPAISPVDPKLMLVMCDMGGAYRSADGGATWRLIHAGQLGGNTRCRGAWHPTERDTVYAVGGWHGTLKASRDGGVTWTEAGQPPGRPLGELAIDPDDPRRRLIGLEDGVAVSLDGGATWRPGTGPTGGAVAFHIDRSTPVARRRLFAATADGIWRSVDGGQAWAACRTGLPPGPIRGFAGGSRVRAARGQVACRLYCTVPCLVTGGTLTGGIHRSDDGGDSWRPVMNPDLNRDLRAADEWAHGPVVQYHQVLCSDAAPERVYAINANTGIPPPHHASVYRSDDAGERWRATYQPDPRFPGVTVAADWQTAAIGQAYQSVPYGAAIAPGDPQVLITVDDMRCRVTHDGGATWTNGHSLAPGPGRGAGVPNSGLVVTSAWQYHLDPTDSRRRYIAYTDIGLAISADGGATWRWWGSGRRPPWTNTCYELAFDPQTKGRVWGAFSQVHDIPNANIILGRHRATGAGGIAVSDDHGDNWTACAGLPAAPATGVVLDPASPPARRRLYAAFFGPGIHRSLDGGKTWTACNAGLPEKVRRVCRLLRAGEGAMLALLTAPPDGSFRDEGQGLYRSADGGDTWTAIGPRPALLWPKDIAIDPADPRRILVGAADPGRDRPEQGGLWATADGGATWRMVLRKGREHFGAAFSPHHPGWIYATLCEDADGPALWLSKDGGRQWQPFPDLPFRNIQRVCFDHRQPDLIYLTTFGASVLRGPALPGGK